MKTREFELLIKTAGASIKSVMIEDEWDGNFTLRLWMNDPTHQFLDENEFYIETAVGHRRRWRNLGRLYRFVRESGWDGSVEISYGPKRIKFGTKTGQKTETDD